MSRRDHQQTEDLSWKTPTQGKTPNPLNHSTSSNKVFYNLDLATRLWHLGLRLGQLVRHNYIRRLTSANMTKHSTSLQLEPLKRHVEHSRILTCLPSLAIVKCALII